MKKAVLAITVAVAVSYVGCEKREPVSKEPQEFARAAIKASHDDSRLTIGETDSFNPGNNIESIRKKRLTIFGRASNSTPLSVPDQTEYENSLNKPNMTEVKIGMMDQGSIEIPSYPFDYENDITALKRLHKEHNLDSIISLDMSGMEIAQALNIYTHNFLKDGSEPSAVSWMTETGPSAFTITDLRKNKGIGGRSEHYAALLCQLSLSCGFVSRLTGMHTIDANGEILDHTVCEIFITAYDKWVVFDPFSKATYYLRDGIPLNAYEIRDLALNNHYRDISTIISVGDFTDVVTVREKLLPRYKYLYFWRMNDIISKSSGGRSMSWQELFQTHLVWEDTYSLISEGSFDKNMRFTNSGSGADSNEGVRYVTHDIKDFYWKVNQVTIGVERIADEKARVTIDSMTPNFDRFVIRLEEDGKTSKFTTTNKVMTIDSAVFNLTVIAINALNVPGHVSSIAIMNP